MNTSMVLAVLIGIILLLFCISSILNHYACEALEKIDREHTLLKYKILLYNLQQAKESSPLEVVWSIFDIACIDEGYTSFKFYLMVRRLLKTGDDSQIRSACLAKLRGARS